MDSNLDHHDQHYRNQQQQQQMNSGLTRYKSAPSSYFGNMLNTVNFGGEDFDEVLNPLRVSSPETDRIFQRFVSSGGSTSSSQNPILQQSLCQLRGNEQAQQQFLGSMKHEEQDFHSQHQRQQHMIYSLGQSQQGHNSVVVSTSAMNDSFMAANSVAMDRLPPMRMGCGGGGSNPNLIRQSSSPAGFFSQMNIENGFPVMRGMGNYGTSSGGTRVESSFPSSKRLKSHMNFSSGPTSSGLLARIPEIESKSMGATNSDDGNFDETLQKDDQNYVGGFATGTWDDSSILSENFLKGLGDSDRSSFPNMDLSESQSNEGRSRPPTALTHHLSLPTSSAELSAMFQDSVPLRIRAKRGCATHPRSIAERVRRTKISERMRKLQELVPNMDKQTNTSDMLDLAVDYIKELQKQAETLAEQRAKCTCSSKQKS